MKEAFMKVALLEAYKAYQKDEVPVGAVIVKDGKIIARAFNTKEKKKSCIFHAEINAINKASKKLKTWNLKGTQIYTTKQPCLMCYGAIMSARIDEIYFGAFDDRFGLEVDKYNELNDKGFNHKAIVEGGILEKECSEILTKFFKVKRV